MHPKQAEAVAKAEAARKQRESVKANIELLQKAHGLRFMIVNSPSVINGSNKGGAITLAYRMAGPFGRDVIEVATAICHPNDTFNKYDGKLLAAQNFAAGKVIQMRRWAFNYGDGEPMIRRPVTAVLESAFTGV